MTPSEPSSPILQPDTRGFGRRIRLHIFRSDTPIHVRILAGLIVAVAAATPLAAVFASQIHAWLPALILIGAVPWFRTVLRSCRALDVTSFRLLLVFCVYALLASSWGIKPLFAAASVVVVLVVLLVAALNICTAALLPEPLLRRAQLVLVGAYLLGIGLLAAVLTRVLSLRSVRGFKDIALFGYNRAAIVLVIFLPLVLALVRTRYPGRRGWLVVALVTGALGLTLVQSVSATSKLCFVIGVVAFFVFRRFFVPAAATAGTVIVAGLLAGPWLARLAYPHMSDITFIDWRVSEMSARLEIWHDLVPLFDRSPLFGSGPNTVRFMADLPLTRFYYYDSLLMHPHSMVVETWIDLGAVGVILLAAVFLAALRDVGRVPEPRRTVFAVTLVNVFVIGSVSHGMWQPWWLGAAGLVPLFALTLRKDARRSVDTNRGRPPLTLAEWSRAVSRRIAKELPLKHSMDPTEDRAKPMPVQISPKRRRTIALVILHDFVMSWLAFALAMYLRLGERAFADYASVTLLGGLAFAGIAVVVYRMLGLTKALWQYTSIPELIQIAGGALLAIALWMVAAFTIMRLDLVPRSLPVILWFVTVVLLGALRLGYRMLRERRQIRRARSSVERPTSVLVIGAGDDGAMFVRAARAARGQLDIVGVVDHKSSRLHGSIGGAPVLGGLNELGAIIDDLIRRGKKPDGAVLSLSPASLTARQIDGIMSAAWERGVRLYRQPALADLLSGSSERMSPVALTDLLGRQERDTRAGDLAELATGQRVIVTGAGGTIGSELVRQIAALQPAAVGLIEQSEFNLYSIEMEVREMVPDGRVSAFICDIRRADKVARVFRDFRPDLVIHAAALKHVPLVELNPGEGVLTNVRGTINVAEAACAVDAKAMVLISTDKAVNPTNVMGAAKRLAEAYLRHLDLLTTRKCRTRFMTVRFGNVIGSSGSVIPLFQQQLERGGPLTVTHPEITRYFMTVGEAVSLVLRAAAYGLRRPDERGRIFVLDMGQPVKIVELARQMIALAGLVPDRDIKIEFVGLRPGEKLHEELFDAHEEQVPTEEESIRAAIPRTLEDGNLPQVLGELCAAAERDDEERVRELLERLVPGYRPEERPMAARSGELVRLVAGG